MRTVEQAGSVGLLTEGELNSTKMNNTTIEDSNGTSHTLRNMQYSLGGVIAQASFVIFILILDVGGNCLVCWAIIRYRRLRTITNYFIISLAVSDLLVAFLSMPFRIHHVLNQMKWNLGKTVCQFWIFSDLPCSAASMTNLSLISVDRYLALSYPLTYRSIMTKRKGTFAILLVWSYALIISGMSFKYWDKNAKINISPACSKEDKYYYVFAIILSFFLPLVILVVAYSMVFKVALTQARKLQLLNISSFKTTELSESNDFHQPRPSVVSIGKVDRRRRKSIVRELKATKTLAIVVGTFIFCWLPFFIIMFIVQFCPQCFQRLPSMSQEAIGIVFAYVLPLLNSAINPIIYSSFNSDFRFAFREIVFKILALFSWSKDPRRRSQGTDTEHDCTAVSNIKCPMLQTYNYQNGNTAKEEESNSRDAEVQDDAEEDEFDTKKVTETSFIVKDFSSAPKIIIEKIYSRNGGEESL